MSTVEQVSSAGVGVLVHGRNLQAPDLNRLLWGFGAISADGIGAGGINNRMGTVPTAVMTILDAGPETVNLSIGSGASSHELANGQTEIEAEYIQRQAADFETLERFPQIRSHPKWADEDSRQLLATVIEGAHLDTEAQNTRQEIRNAARYFSGLGVDRVIQVTGFSHAVRCLMDRTDELMKLGLERDVELSAEQRWTLVSDNEPYPFHYLSAPVLVEPPHRGDIMSALPEDIWMTRLLRDGFRLGPKGQVRLAMGMRELIDTSPPD